jgi:hypothetical protein
MNSGETIMKKYSTLVAGLIVSVAMLAVASPAMASHVNVGVNLGIPGVFPAPVYVEPQPVYVQPRSVYFEPQPYYVQEPVYVQPRPFYSTYDNGWREHHWHGRHRREHDWRRHERHERHDEGRGHDHRGHQH